MTISSPYLSSMRSTLPLLIAVLSTAPLCAQDVDVRPTDRAAPRDTLERARYADPIDIVSVGFDLATMGALGNFFEKYQALGGKSTSTPVYTAPRLTARLVMGSQLRLVFDVAMHRASFTDLYEVRTSPGPDGLYVASIYEDFSAMSVPILGGIEYAPVRTQFTSYVGAAAGPAVTFANWVTSIEHTTNGYTRPRTNVDGVGVGPAIRLYAGVDLRFDKLSRTPGAFRGLFFEAGWLFLPVTRDYFEAIRGDRSDGAGPNSDSGTLYLGGLTITFGLNLQVLRR